MRGLCHDKKSELESFADKPGIEQEINHPIAPTNDNSQIWQMPTTINLDSVDCCNHHDKSESTLALGKPTKFHICPRTLLYYLPIMVFCHVWFKISCGKSSHYFIKELPAGLGLRSANSILSASLDLRSTSITNLSASFG
jgi:hypothetical protein